jgi:hypothetical protein
MFMPITHSENADLLAAKPEDLDVVEEVAENK